MPSACKKKKKKSLFSLASNLFALFIAASLGFSCASQEKKHLFCLCTASSPYPPLLPVARTAPLYCRQVPMVSGRVSALHCRLRSCIISWLSSTDGCLQSAGGELGVGYFLPVSQISFMALKRHEERC